VGRPDPAVTDIRVVDGEICARGPMTPLCYVDAPELDRRHRLPGGWVRTGDAGFFDADGTLHVVRRLKRVVIRGGYTISPAEVERALDGHPVVAEAACVPVPDPDLGERLCACVTVRPGHRAPSLDQLTAFLRERGLSRRKLPEHLVVLPELPLGRTGKVCLPTVTRLAAEHHAAGRGEQSVGNA
jgi:acyl-CoA synthetase (AMP-forming)/AMP-acid ligase II